MYGYWANLRPDAILVWRNPEVRKRLQWYLMVLKGERPPRFKVSRNYMLNDIKRNELKITDTSTLWKIHKKHSSALRKVLHNLKEGLNALDDVPREGEISLLEIKAELARRLSNPCSLCERKCNIDRARKIGACRLDDKAYVHSAFLHMGEEAPLVPSGTIFYGGCNFTCVYCQNHDISQEYPRSGKPVSPRELAKIQDALAAEGARNINHVGGDPTPSLHIIIESMLYLNSSIPQLWNSNMYLTKEALDLLIDLIDIWLPDFKYGNNNCALRLSAVPNYWDIITRNLQIISNIGDVIIRHLILPGHLECCTSNVLEFIAHYLPKNRILVNIMDQYRPMHLVARYNRWAELKRRPYGREIKLARDIADSLGLCWRPVS